MYRHEINIKRYRCAAPATAARMLARQRRYIRSAEHGAAAVALPDSLPFQNPSGLKRVVKNRQKLEGGKTGSQKTVENFLPYYQ